MDISPAVQTPRAGDPITAAWAAQVADAIASTANHPTREDSVASPFGLAELPPLSPIGGKAVMPMPFDCAIVKTTLGDRIYIWLPHYTTATKYVVYNGKPLGPAQGQTVGDSNTAWVPVNYVALDAARFVYLKFHTDSSTGEVDGWTIDATSSPWTPQSGGTGANAEPPQVLLAFYNIATGGNPTAGADNKWPSGRHGLVQYHHGTVVVGGSEDIVLDTDTTPGDPPGESLNRFVDDPEAEEPKPDGQIQLRQFHDPNDKQTVRNKGATGDNPTVEDMHLLFRLVGHGTGTRRPKLVYVDPTTGPFWVCGGDASVNYGTSLKLGDAQNGYITISAVR